MIATMGRRHFTGLLNRRFGLRFLIGEPAMLDEGSAAATAAFLGFAAMERAGRRLRREAPFAQESLRA